MRLDITDLIGKDYEKIKFRLDNSSNKYNSIPAKDLSYNADKKGFLLLSDNAKIYITKREEHVLNCLSRGMSAKQMAFSLKISVRTVENHIANIKKKVNLTDRHSIIELYLDNFTL